MNFIQKRYPWYQLYYVVIVRLTMLNSLFINSWNTCIVANICILFSLVIIHFSVKRQNLNARPTFAFSYLFLWSRCLLLRRRYFILGPCINSAIQRFTFKALEQSGKPHSGKYSGLFAFSEQLRETDQFYITLFLPGANQDHDVANTYTYE